MTKYLRVAGSACLLSIVLFLASTGCSKPSEPVVKSDDAPKSATTTTAAHGVMRAGARSHKRATQ